MKTLKLTLVAMVLALAVVGTANADGIHAKNQAVKITIEKASTVPGLIKAMYDQLNPDFLKVEQETYTQRVDLNGRAYFITGTRLQWVLFFKNKPKVEIHVNTFGIGTR